MIKRREAEVGYRKTAALLEVSLGLRTNMKPEVTRCCETLVKLDIKANEVR